MKLIENEILEIGSERFEKSLYLLSLFFTVCNAAKWIEPVPRKSRRLEATRSKGESPTLGPDAIGPRDSP